MKVEINVDELQFKEILEGELKNLSQEKIHEIILESIRIYFVNNPNIVKNLFVEQNSWSYRESPSSYLKQILEQEIPQGAFADLVDGMLATLKENYNNILKDALVDLMISGMFNSYGFEDKLRNSLRKLQNS